MNGGRKIILKLQFITDRYKWKRIDKCHLDSWVFYRISKQKK